MAAGGNVYPVGLIFVGTPGQEEQQTTILPVSDDPGKAGGVTIKQEKPEHMQMYMQSCSSATSQGKESAVPGSSGVAIKQELEDDLGIPAEGHNFDPSNEKDKEVEDRNSETYWEKRKRFTLAFAAGLRKFIQMHPELLRYGPKKSQGGASATVTSSGAAAEEEEEAMEEEVEPPSAPPVPTPRTPRGRSPRGRRGRGAAAATRRAAAEPADSAYTPTTRKRGRSMRNSRNAEEEEQEPEEAVDLPGGVMIKTEPTEDDD